MGSRNQQQRLLLVRTVGITGWSSTPAGLSVHSGGIVATGWTPTKPLSPRKNAASTSLRASPSGTGVSLVSLFTCASSLLRHLR
jgi:hypothetical protein